MENDELKSHLDKINAEIAQNLLKRDEQIKAAGVETAAIKAEFKSTFENLATQVAKIQADLLRPKSAVPSVAEETSFGQKFIDSDEWKQYCQRGWHKGGMALKIPADVLHKTTITSSTVGSSTPGILVPQRIADYIAPPARRVRVRSLIPFARTTANAVEFVKRNVFTNAASPQTEGSAKAESALTFSIESAAVRTLAHWIPATRQVLEDWPQLQSIIDTELLIGLADEEDDQLLNGDGVGLSLHGLTHEATDYAGTYDAASDTRLDKLNHAIAELNAADYVPDAVILNPVDWRIIQVIKENVGGANLGAYVMGGPGASLASSVWGLNVALTTAMTVGSFIVGQFVGSVRGYDRMDATVDVSTEHEDYFVKNLVAIRVEERLTIAVTRPAAFRYGTF